MHSLGTGHVCLSVRPSIGLTIHSFAHLPACLSVPIYVHLPIILSIFRSVCPAINFWAVCLSVDPCINLWLPSPRSVCQSVHLFHLFVLVILSISLSINLLNCLSIHFSICPFLCLPDCTSIFFYIHPSTHVSISVYISIFLSVYLFVVLWVHLSVHVLISLYWSFYQSIAFICLSICLNIFQSVHLSKCQSIHLFMWLVI